MSRATARIAATRRRPTRTRRELVALMAARVAAQAVAK